MINKLKEIANSQQGNVKMLKDEENLKGTYFITTEGELFKYKMNKNGRETLDKIKGFIDRNGYVIFKLMNNNNKLTNLLAHRIVCKYFLNDFDEKLTVDHLNGDKTDNRIVNLECVTLQENLRRWRNSDKFKPSRGRMTKEEIIEARELWNNGMTMLEICKKYDRHVTNISNMLKGKSYKNIK